MVTQTTERLDADLVDRLERFVRDYCADDVLELADKYPRDQRSLWVDWRDLYQFDVDVANDYLEHPDQIRKHIAEAVRLYDLPVDIDLSDVNVRVFNLPDGRTYDVGGYRSDDIGEYIDVSGQVAKRTEVKPKPEMLVFECQRCGTPNEVPQVGSDIQEPHECEGCERNGPFQLKEEDSEFTDHQLVRLQQPPEQTNGGNGATVDVRLEDDVVESVEAGDRVTVSGVMALEQPSQGDIAFDPYIDGQAVEVEETDYDEIDIDEYRDEIEDIAAGEYGDPYDLLVESIAVKIQGMDTIKEAIALQLFGGVHVQYPDGSVDRGDPHVLLLGDPGTAKSKILQAVENIAPRSTYASGKGATAAGMTAAAVRDDFGSQEWSLEAGALVLADKGIACVDEIDKIDDTAVNSLHDALESQEVKVNKAGIEARLPARTALLAAGNPEGGRFDPNKFIAEQIDLDPALMSRFDLMFMLDDQPDQERDSKITSGMVDSHRIAAAYTADDPDIDDDELQAIEPAIPRDILRAYIAHAKQSVTPRIKDDEVQEELEKSFVQIRLSNGEEEDVPVPVTFRKLDGIMRLAEASARVRLSDTVEMQDLDRARRLVGESMRQVGFDEDEGQFDADVIETGQAKSQRDRMDTLKQVIRELQDEHDNGALMADVLDAMTEEGVESAQAQYAVEKLKKRGEVYEPEPGYIQLS
jgi:replicative DNA helicase Mcm